MADSKFISKARADRILAVQADLAGVRAILDAYKIEKEGPTGADEKIMKILFVKGFAQKIQIPPLKVGFHRLMAHIAKLFSPGKNVNTHFAFDWTRRTRPTKLNIAGGAKMLPLTSPLSRRAVLTLPRSLAVTPIQAYERLCAVVYR